MKVKYKLLVDGNRYPMKEGVADVNAVVRENVQPVDADKVIRDLAQGVKVSYTNRRKGFKLILTNVNKPVKIKRQGKASGFIEATLEGVVTGAQIKVAAADRLKGKEGYHRTVCLVNANGKQYKVKCKHKGLSYTETVHKCEIVSSKII